MDYRVFRKSSGEDENSIEAHVLARAYRAVWRCTHGSEPVGQHQIAGLELVIDFGGKARTRDRSAYQRDAFAARPDVTSTEHSDVTSTSRYDESAFATADVLRESDMTTDLWARVRQFGKRMPSEELEQVISELREQDRLSHSGSQQGAHCRNRRRDD